MYARGWRSVCKINGLPAKYSRNFVMPHTILKHSFSKVEYLVSAGASFLLAHATGYSLSSSCCMRAAASPQLDASVRSMNGLLWSGSFKIGRFNKQSCKLLKAFSCACPHRILFGCPLRVRSVNGAATAVNVGMWAR